MLKRIADGRTDLVFDYVCEIVERRQKRRYTVLAPSAVSRRLTCS
jgi:hypothetical protein